MDDEERIGVFQETGQLAILSDHLLRRLEPEPEFVRRLVEEEIRKLMAEGRWKERPEEGKPWIRSVERERYILRIAVIHARGGEHITGADLVFELKDKKIVLVQSKRVGSNGRFTFNRLQLSKLAELEAQLNFRSDSVVIQTFPQTLFYPIIPCRKASFYHLIMADSLQTQERFFHISEIMFTLGNRKTASQNEFINMGMTQKEFDDMFWNCKTGAPDVGEELKRDMLHLYSLITNRIILWLDIEEKLRQIST
jgi:hypothetical protein